MLIKAILMRNNGFGMYRILLVRTALTRTTLVDVGRLLDLCSRCIVVTFSFLVSDSVA